MFDPRSAPSSTAPLGGLLDISSAPVAFGYYEENATDAETITRCHDRSRSGPIGWWNRHRQLGIGVGMTLVTTLGFLPAVQNAVILGW
ncbi:hypothetical protein [Nocardia sp. NPDC050175]|uniref:hypothetical protein n=1 Tax=Nocardia sp. NPDC050175 TaxID=3364317 RepID=UPI00378A9EA5